MSEEGTNILHKLQQIVDFKQKKTFESKKQHLSDQKLIIELEKKKKRVQRFEQIQKHLGLNKSVNQFSNLPTLHSNQLNIPKLKKQEQKEIANFLEQEREKKMNYVGLYFILIQKKNIKFSISNSNSKNSSKIISNNASFIYQIPEFDIYQPPPGNLRNVKLYYDELQAEKPCVQHNIYQIPQQSYKQELKLLQYLQNYQCHQQTIEKAKQTLSIYEPQLKQKSTHFSDIIFEKLSNFDLEDDKDEMKINLKKLKQNFQDQENEEKRHRNSEKKLDLLLNSLGIDLRRSGPIDQKFIEKLLNEENQNKKQPSSRTISNNKKRHRKSFSSPKLKITAMMVERLAKLYPDKFKKSTFSFKTFNDRKQNIDKEIISQNRMKLRMQPIENKVITANRRQTNSLHGPKYSHFKELLDKINNLDQECKFGNQELNCLIEDMDHNIGEKQQKYNLQMDLGFLKKTK